MARKVQDVRLEEQILVNLGNVYFELGRDRKAMDYYEKCIEIVRRIGDLETEGIVLMQQGNVYWRWGQYSKAVEYYEKSLKIRNKIGDAKGEGVTLNNLGNVYWHWGQYSKAVEYFERSMKIRNDIGDTKGEALTLTNLGEAYHARGEQGKALASYQKALEIYEKIGVPTNRPKDLIGNFYLDEGEIGKAEPFIKQGNYDASLGRLYLVKADYPSAEKPYESLLKSAEENRAANDLFTAYVGLGLSYEGMGDNPQAVEYYRKAVAQTEDLRSSLNPAERETFFDVRHKRILPDSRLTKGLPVCSQK